MAITILATVFVFSLIVFVHEFGHFITAKWAGMQVDEFALGFGPKVASHRYGETEYSLRAIPLGGFNRIAGMSAQEGNLNERSFINRPVRHRLIVIAAGAAMNFVLAIVLIWGLMATVGTSTVSTEPYVGSIIADSPAEKADLAAGDRLISIGGTPIHSWGDISPAVGAHRGEVITVVIERNGQTIERDMVPQEESQTKRPIIGIMPMVTKESHGIAESAYLAVMRTGSICKAMLVGLYQMVTGSVAADVAGPIGIAQLAGQVASVGLANLLMFTAFLSINLGILNLLPIPMLDGGYIILLILEGLTKRRMPERALYYIQVTGMVILGAIFVFAMFQDISRF